MSEHVWAQEQITAYVAGGCEPQEAERFEAHIRECPSCTTALQSAQTLDRGLDGLFAAVRPSPALEDRMIRSLRAVSARDLPRLGWRRKLVWGMAASVALGVAGAGAGVVLGGRELPFPGQAVASRYFLEHQPLVFRPDPDFPLQRDLDGTVAGRDEKPNLAEMSKLDRDINGNWTYRSSAAQRDPEAMARELSERTVAAAGGERWSDSMNRADKSESSDRFHFYMGHSGDGVASKARDPKLTQELGNLQGAGTSLGRSGWSRSRAENGSVSDLALHDSTKAGPMRGMSSGKESPPQLHSSTSTLYAKADMERAAEAARAARADFDKARAMVERFNPSEHKVQLGVQFGMGEANKNYKALAGVQSSPAPPAAVEPAQNKPAAATPEPTISRKIIRSGDIEFEIDSFDTAVETVTRLVTGIKGAFIATINSEKLANGKVKGSIVVRVPPETLDGLVLNLRRDLGKLGELKGQRIGSQDITKQYTDMESRLKAARTMEERLLKMIKDGKGEIKQLLEAEKELGVWRTKIEELEGEMRYYSNLISLSTLTITLAEKEIRAAAGLTESERVQAGIEVEDVDKAYRDALAAVAEAKGRISKRELKQLSAGQFNATLQFEVAPEASGPMRDRLRQLGRVARLEIDRVQQAEGGAPQRDAKVKRGDTVFLVQIYNLMNVAARETATMELAALDVRSAYTALQEAVSRAKGRVLTARLDEQDRQNVTAQFDFEVRRADEGAIQAALTAAGEAVSRNVIRAPESENVTDSKLLFRTKLVSAARTTPRETSTLGIEVTDVDAAADVIAAQITEVNGRTVHSDIAHERSGRVTAHLVYTVPLNAAASLVEKFKKLGTVRVQESVRDPQAKDSKYAIAQIDIRLANVPLIVPKDDGLWPQVRDGLAVSAKTLMASLFWLIVGLCVVVPWAAVLYGSYRIVRRLFFRPTAAASGVAAPGTTI